MTTIDRPLMKCGCVAQGFCSSKGGVPYDPPIPSCVVHSCTDIAETPNLEERKAQCAYKCGSERPSSLGLPFFKYLGEGSPESVCKCRCGYYYHAHLPLWEAKIKVERRWFKHERYISTINKTFNATEEDKGVEAEKQADFFRDQTFDPNTKVFNATVVSITPKRSVLKCNQFEAIGAQEKDEYYCGCHGWD